MTFAPRLFSKCRNAHVCPSASKLATADSYITRSNPIDKTNYWAARMEGPEIMKVSYAALPWLRMDAWLGR